MTSYMPIWYRVKLHTDLVPSSYIPIWYRLVTYRSRTVQLTEADRLEGKATLTSDLLLGRSEVLRSLRHHLRAQSQGHHTIDRLEERGMERGIARRPSLKGREKAIVGQTNIGTVSKATLGKLLRDGVERIWACPSAYIPS